jgi:energy-coupling factor transporter ATP-binding protein EcfA2
MRLVALTIRGFKRFGNEVTLAVDGEVTALIGPNEAGKTSVLQALAHMNHSEPFAGSERTRGSSEDDASYIRLSFLLEPEDMASLVGIEGAEKVKWYIVTKRADGNIASTLDPPVKRDVSGRGRIAKDLRRAATHAALQPLALDPDSEFDQGDLLALADTLDDAQGEEPPDGLVPQLNSIATLLESDMPEDLPQYISKLPVSLRKLSEREEQDRPSAVVRKALWRRRPQFLMFGEDARTLENSYELTTLSDPPPAALSNLAQLADLDIAALVSAITDERLGEVEELVDRANSQLREYFETKWEQTRLAVAFSTSGTELRLFVRERTGSFWQLAERSDGLRWFVALVAYLHTRRVETTPILLIDEAEQHLHYDGQADLVRAFERQEAVADVIYTTHSAGCLPQDLGTGVRVVGRGEGDASVIRNSLWGRDDLREGAGFSALLMQMGASTFAFAATRRALICEGKTDVALLPTLLRQATDLDALPFQLVPGLANVANDSVVHLDMAAARVAFLVDADDGGAGIITKLRAANVGKERILTLGSTRHRRTLEDLVAPRAFQEAVSQEFARGDAGASIPLAELRSKPRYRSLVKWCERQRPPIEPPDKSAIAQRLLGLARQGEQIVDPSAVKLLKALYAEIQQVLA